ncbi:MAG: 6-phosphofructokinase [Anaerolineae bacterium]|nr:6-phosphofructokinase [Anaerolineae bacterium]
MIKGNLIVGQSGGPTLVINNSLVGVIHEAMQQQAIGGVYGMLNGIAGLLAGKLIDLARESDETLQRLRRTPGAALGSVRYKVKKDDYTRIIDVLRAHNIHYFFYNGGNDSMDTAHQVHLAAQQMGYELHAIGVPKTVDNDLAHTDHCPGYGSAARFVALALRDSGRDTEAMGRSSPVKIVEIMGRNAGWLTAAAALGRDEPGDAPHLIYVPECPVIEAQVIKAVDRIVSEKDHCVIALSEGAVPDSGIEEVDAFGHKMKGGAADYIAALIGDRIGLKVRLDKPNYLQRSFSAAISAVDADEAYRVGRAAVKAAVEGQSDVMITLVRRPGEAYFCDTGTAPLAEIANAEKLLPGEYITPAGDDVTQAFVDYARPLIGEPLPPLGRLAKYAVS